MSNLPAKTNGAAPPATKAATGIYVTMTIEDQLFGIPVMEVQDILGPQRITRVPLAPPEVLGSLNLRGRIVTAIDMRIRLALEKRQENETSMSIVVEHEDELYSLIVDKVGEVLSLSENDYEANPATLDPHWQDVANGVYRLKNSLLVVLNVARVLRLEQRMAA